MTSLNIPLITDAATFTMNKRQQIVTEMITASASATAAPVQKKDFPIAVAVPALVGGMALAVGLFLLVWWIAKRRRREKRLRYEKYQQRQARKRANQPRPSMSSQRSHSSQKSPIREKEFVPPVPALPKHSLQTDYARKPEQGYGYHHDELTNVEYGNNDQYGHYAPQPSIEPEHRSAPMVAPVTLAEPIAAAGNQPKAAKSSRSAARVAAAEKAAEATHGDINTRYQPKKPSPLAIKAAEERALQAAQRGDGLSPNRQVSGEWGVALGSPNNDGTFPQRASYGNDPYLNSGSTRGRSGMYTHDPYASYHGDEVEEVRQDGKHNWV